MLDNCKYIQKTESFLVRIVILSDECGCSKNKETVKNIVLDDLNAAINLYEYLKGLAKHQTTKFSQSSKIEYPDYLLKIIGLFRQTTLVGHKWSATSITPIKNY